LFLDINLIGIGNVELELKKRTFEGHTGTVYCLQFDSQKLISGGTDAVIRIWDTETGALYSKKKRYITKYFRRTWSTYKMFKI